MISRLTIALPIALLGEALFAASAPAQVRGMRASVSAPRTRVSFGLIGRGRLARPYQRPFFTGFGFYPDYDFDYEPVPSEVSPPPAQVVVAQPAQPPVPVAGPGLILEERDGQWVRIPTDSQLPVSPQSTQPLSAQPSSLQLPPAVLVFRDGHQEEVERYTIKGDVLYTSADYWSTGSWRRKIAIADLDVPASLKLNAERGAKFNLPSGPNEIVVRF